jgi:DNA-binding response OmpR family regulator
MEILIVDDDKNIGDILSIILDHEGYKTMFIDKSEEAKEMLASKVFDLYILDIMMEKYDGYNICEAIRRQTDNPIIFISCLDDEKSLVKALELGGDDFIRKPFNSSEVVARVKSHLRRKRLTENEIFNIGQCTFFRDKNLVLEGETKIHLSPLESDIIFYLSKHIDRIVTYKEIYEHVWHEKYVMDKTAIATRISGIRKKIPSINISSVRGKGYRLER